jgi:hypothetical protein
MSILTLYDKFTKGLAWINKQRNLGIDVSKEMARFELDVAIPLDQAWQNLSEEKQNKFIEEWF